MRLRGGVAVWGEAVLELSSRTARWRVRPATRLALHLQLTKLHEAVSLRGAHGAGEVVWTMGAGAVVGAR